MTVGTIIPVKATIVGPTVVASCGIANYSVTIEYNDGKILEGGTTGLGKSFEGGMLNKGVFIAPYTSTDLIGSIRAVVSLNGVKIVAEQPVTIKAPEVAEYEPKADPLAAESKLGWIEIIGQAELKSKQTSRYALRLHFTDGSTSETNAKVWSCTNVVASVDAAGTVTAPFATSGETMILRAMYHDDKTNMNISAIPKTIKII